MNLEQAMKAVILARAWMALANWQHTKGKKDQSVYSENKSYALTLSIPNEVYFPAIEIVE